MLASIPVGQSIVKVSASGEEEVNKIRRGQKCSIYLYDDFNALKKKAQGVGAFTSKNFSCKPSPLFCNVSHVFSTHIVGRINVKWNFKAHERGCLRVNTVDATSTTAKRRADFVNKFACAVIHVEDIHEVALKAYIGYLLNGIFSSL